jgi:acyl-CoA dehydrogenase
MDELTRAVEELVDGLCRRHADERGGFGAGLWTDLAAADVPLGAVPVEFGGAGASPQAAMAAVRVAARACAPLPLAETGLAAWLLAEAGRRVPTGALTAAVAGPAVKLEQAREGPRVTGRLDRVPWAREAELVVVLVEGGEGSRLLLLGGGDLAVERGRNLAGEPRDGVRLDCRLSPHQVVGSDLRGTELIRRGALARTVAMAGAAEAALALTSSYVGERRQFGRPLAAFQAVQQRLAIMVGEVRAMRAAADAATAAAEAGSGEEVAIAAAKAFASAAAGSVAAAAHQLHGAIGYTEEHRLHRATTRLWSWREEFGDETCWSRSLGAAALAAEAPGPWELLTGAAAS